VNWAIYFVSGGILDKLLGIRKVENSKLIKLVKEVKEKIGIKSKVKVGFGEYPILNAMAYGSVFDKRIAIIAEDLDQIPEDELRGIVAHELAHTKGKHTLLLTIITSIDLIVRMFLGIPATFYDYTFGDPQIPLFVFILLNLMIYIILFVFVRILEGKADLKAKISGYGNDLVKALYNLESFYATGREIGFNTMLLSEEKITKDNQLLDYMNTASYLYHSMIKPSKVSLMGSFLNSHPPSYFRIAAILDNKLKPTKEAILPFICLRKSKQRKYAQNFEKSRQAFKTIANSKFKELFQINDISLLLHNLRRKDLFKYDLNKDYVFKNKITEAVIVGQLKDINFIEDICSSDMLIITNLKTQKEEDLESSKYTRIQIDLNEVYYLQKGTQLTLKEISLNGKKENKNFVFLDEKNNQINKPILKTKLPNSVRIVRNLEDDDIFFKDKGKLKVMKCVNVSKSDNFLDIELTFSNDKTNSDPELQKYNMKELIIRPRKIYLVISKDFQFRKSEVKVINWLIKYKILVHLYIKKPVNNYEIGRIQNLEINLEKLKKKSKVQERDDGDYLKLKNIFDKEVIIPYKKIESIGFEYSSATVQLKSSTSFSSRLGYRILKKFKPEKIIIT
jgi:Zn-dependent protease with chaperone function/sporulation protein YlmC with PRC-barrel domain